MIKKLTTKTYHLQCKGLIIRFTRTIDTSLSLCDEDYQRSYGIFAPPYIYLYRIQIHPRTNKWTNMITLNQQTHKTILLSAR